MQQVKESAPIMPAVKHNLIIENRTNLTATGILRVISYDENGATAETGQGLLVIGGKNLKVSEMSCQSGELKVQGEIEFVQYEAARQTKGGFLGKLMR